MGVVMKYQAKAIINAPVEKVWNILQNAKLYPAFDPFCQKINGEIGQDNFIVIFSKLNPKHGFKVKVIELMPSQKMVWAGGMPFNLFKGVRTFKLFAKDDYTSEILVEEIFSGILLPIIKHFLPDMSESFSAFVLGLKKYAEKN